MVSSEEVYVGLSHHIADLRATLIKALLIFFVGFVIALIFYLPLLQLFTPSIPNNNIIKEKIEYERINNLGNKDITYTLPTKFNPVTLEKSVHLSGDNFQIQSGGYIEYEKRIIEPQLVLLSPLEGFVITLKVCFWVALAGTAPLWMAVIMQFIVPGLREQEKQPLIPFLMLSCLFMTGGVLFAYMVTMPFANHYFALFNNDIGLNLWSLSHYVDYSLILMMGHAISFELCLILLFLVHYGWISAEWMIEKRRFMIVLAFVLGAILTPPDILTQFMMAIPLIVVYEIAILYAKRASKKEII